MLEDMTVKYKDLFVCALKTRVRKNDKYEQNNYNLL